MKIIGITGGTGAGKSVVCAELKERGALVVDCDKIARQVVEKGQPALNEIAEVFGDKVLLPDGGLDRKAMSRIVFADGEKLRWLNSITHKYIFAEMHRLIEDSDASVAVLDVPLLFQCDFPIECDITVAITADRETRIRRIMERDSLTREDAEARMSKQLSDEEYRRLADVCFENDGDIMSVRLFAEKLLQDVLKK